MSDPSVKTYCITFGVADVNLPALVQYLFDSADVLAFWNYIPLVYCVKSLLLATELTYKLRPFFPPTGPLMVVEINAANLNGLLPPDAWTWFYLEHHQKTHAPSFYYPPILALPKN
jgi:hypothetical protein